MKKHLLIITLFSTLFIFGCDKSDKIQIGDTVNITYTGTLLNGEVFENNTKTVIVGNGDIIQGIDKALINKNSNQNFSIKLDPKDAYQDQYYKYGQQRISINTLSKLGLDTEEGSFIQIDQFSGVIIGQETDTEGYLQAIIETNPPQTRQKTKYDIQINSIEKKI